MNCAFKKTVFDSEIPVKQQWIDFAHNCEYERVFADNAEYTLTNMF